MSAEKPFKCGRYENEARGGPFKIDAPSLREDGTCSYCGSITEERFFECADAGMKITPTDKSYKAYVDMPDPAVGQPRVISSSNFERQGSILVTAENIDTLPLDQWQRAHYLEDKNWVEIGTTSAIKTAKFYFQHLSDEGQTKFIEYLNGQKFSLATPGYFYSTPYFAQRRV